MKMTDNNHPITPPPELVQQWWTEFERTEPDTDSLVFIATQAAHWGADQELEACCEWASQFNYDDYRYQDELHALRRPKLSSLKEQALEALKHAEEGWRPIPEDCALIRRALESLPD